MSFIEKLDAKAVNLSQQEFMYQMGDTSSLSRGKSSDMLRESLERLNRLILRRKVP